MTDIFKNIKDVTSKAPVWAAGISTVILTATICSITFYSTARGEIKDYLDDQSKLTQDNFSLHERMVSSILGMVNVNAKQIEVLSESLHNSQKEIQQIHATLEITQQRLDDCQVKGKRNI